MASLEISKTVVLLVCSDIEMEIFYTNSRPAWVSGVLFVTSTSLYLVKPFLSFITLPTLFRNCQGYSDFCLKHSELDKNISFPHIQNLTSLRQSTGCRSMHRFFELTYVLVTAQTPQHGMLSFQLKYFLRIGPVDMSVIYAFFPFLRRGQFFLSARMVS